MKKVEAQRLKRERHADREGGGVIEEIFFHRSCTREQGRDRAEKGRRVGEQGSERE